MQALLRSAVPEDHEGIRTLMVRVIKASIGAPHQADMIENVIQNLQIWHIDPEASLHIVAVGDDEIVGVILVKEFWNLCSLFVSQEYQRGGIGRKLVFAAIDGCRKNGSEQAICLNSAPQAVSFYHSLGFVPRESSQQLPPGFKSMKLVLGASEA